MNKKNLYRFRLDCGRSGELESVFTATPQEVEKVMGRGVYFGEILGKHSSISTTLAPSMLKTLSEDQEKIEWFDATVGTIGYSPLDYIDQEESEDY